MARLAWHMVAVIAVVAATALLLRAQASDSERLSGDYRVIEEPPRLLADDAAAGSVPPAVAARFVEPVVAARRLAEPPSCEPRWAGGPPGLPATAERLAERRRAVVAELGAPVGWVGEVGLVVVQEGVVDGVPSEAVCAGEPVADGWRTDPAAVRAAAPLSAAEAVRRGVDGRAFRAVSVDVTGDGGRWALVERRGWWLAHDVTGRSRLGFAVAVGADRQLPDLRVVLVAADGRLLSDRSITAASGQLSLSGTVPLGPYAAVVERTAVGPVLMCDRGWCAWLARAYRDRLVAVSNHGSHPWDAPPLGAIAWCPSSRRLVGTGTGAEHFPDGRLVLGGDGTGLWTWPVVDVDGTAVVDLAAGGPAGSTPGQASLEGQRCEFPHAVWGVPESLLAQLRERAQYSGATIHGRFLARDGFELRLWLDPHGAVHVSHRRP